MKKFFISLNLIVIFFFFTINFAYCEEDFFIDTPFEDAKSSSKLIQDKTMDAVSESGKKKTSWF